MKFKLETFRLKHQYKYEYKISLRLFSEVLKTELSQ